MIARVGELPESIQVLYVWQIGNGMGWGVKKKRWALARNFGNNGKCEKMEKANSRSLGGGMTWTDLLSFFEPLLFPPLSLLLSRLLLWFSQLLFSPVMHACPHGVFLMSTPYLDP